MINIIYRKVLEAGVTAENGITSRTDSNVYLTGDDVKTISSGARVQGERFYGKPIEKK